MRLIELRKADHVAIIDMLGAVEEVADMALLGEQLAEILGMIRFDEEIRLVILEDKGKGAFSIPEELLVNMPDRLGFASYSFSSVADMISKIESPVIAGLEGDAIGPGLEWILACDMRTASEASRFGLPHVVAGSIPSDGGTQRLARLVGRNKALEMILTGESIDAEEALRIGLINRIVPQQEVSKAVTDLARDIASSSPLSIRYAKEAIHKGMELTLEQGLRLEADLYFLMHATKDRTEGIKAFQEKREPMFEGR